MEAHPRNLKAVFRSDIRLVVPLFQRPYQWVAEKQWRPLWLDVVETAERGPDAHPHFMGAVVLDHQSSAHGSLEVREVIDGQQRLTTLQLLIAALRDNVVEVDPTSVVGRRLTKLLENDPDLVDQPEERHKLWPTNQDRAHFAAVMVGDHRGAGHDPSGPRITGAYTWFRDAIHAHLAGMPSETAAEQLARLADVVFEKLELVVIDLGPQDNAQVIFETLNARGTPLRAADLVKNLLFRTLQEGGRPVELLYDRHWERFERTERRTEDWSAEIRQGRLTLPRIDAFLGYFLVVLLGREVQAHQLFPRTRAFVDRDADRAEEFLRAADRYAGIYLQVEAGHSEDPEERGALARMAIADSTTAVPVLMWLFANAAGTERRTAVQAIESYLVRRSLCRLTTKNYNRMFLELLRRLQEGVDDVGAATRRFLVEQPSDSGLWPGDSEVRRAFATLPLYKFLRRARLQLVLRALDEAATSTWSEPVHHHQALSVEHLMPQAWEEHWPLIGDLDDRTAEAADRAALVHTIGNLTLLSGKLNSSLSHGPWSRKRAEILRHSALALNRSLPEGWDTAGVRARSQWLADLALRTWPRPAQGGDLFASESERDLGPDRDAGEPGPEPRTPDRRQPGLRAAERRDIAVHIAQVFADKPGGTFLSIAQIARTPSSEYDTRQPSPGAISYRLFPPTGACTVPGVSPGRQGGVRGATKVVPAETD